MRNLNVAAVPFVQPPLTDDIDVRWEYTGRYAFAIPSLEALDAIADHAPNGVIEEAAGSGYWAALLRAHGLPVAAFDSHPTPMPAQPAFGTLIPQCYNQSITHSWGGVQGVPAGASARYPERTLMLCWPPAESAAACISLDSYDGDTLVYVGELPWDVLHRSPHQGDPLFFHRLRAEWRRVDQIEIPQWECPADGEHDSLTVWKRNPPTHTGSA